MSATVTEIGVSYAHGPSDTPLLAETIGDNLRRTVARFGEREALVVRHQDYRATYLELWEQVDLAARAFMARGVRKGDRVGIWAPNRHEWVVTQFATARIGAILVTINPAYKAAEVEHALNKAGVSLLVMARGFRQADYVSTLGEVRGSCRACAARSSSRTIGRPSWRRAGTSATRSWQSARRLSRSTTRSTSSTRRVPRARPRGRRSPTVTSSTTRTSRHGT